MICTFLALGLGGAMEAVMSDASAVEKAKLTGKIIGGGYNFLCRIYCNCIDRRRVKPARYEKTSSTEESEE